MEFTGLPVYLNLSSSGIVSWVEGLRMSNTKGHMISLFARLVIVAAVTVSISVVTAILLIQKFGATWNVVPVMVFAIIVPATLAIVINYLYWRPRYKAL